MFKQKKIGPRTFRCTYVGDDEKERMCFRIVEHSDVKKFRTLGCWGNVVKAKFPKNTLKTTHPPKLSPISAKFTAYSYETQESKGVYWKFDSWVLDKWENADQQVSENQLR